MVFIDTGDGSLCCYCFHVFLFPGGPRPSRGVFSAGELTDFAGKQGEINASQATQRTVPCVREPSPVFLRKTSVGGLCGEIATGPVGHRNDTEGCSLFPVPCSLMPRRSGVPVAIDDRRYRAGLFPVPCSLFPVLCSLFPR